MGLGRAAATGLVAAVLAVGTAACTADTPASTAQSEGSGAGTQTSSGATGGGDTATGSDITALFERAQTGEDIPGTVTTDIDASTSRFIGESSGTRFYIARSPSDDAVLCLVVDRTGPGDPSAPGGTDQDSGVPWAAACGDDGLPLIMDDTQYVLHTDPFWEPQSGGDLVGGYVEVVDDAGE